MNPPTTQSPTPGRWPRLAWLPIPLLVLAIAALWVADLRTEYLAPRLQTVLNFLTRTMASLLIVYLAGRSFLLRGEPGLLFLGCGVAIWGAAGVVTTILVTRDANLGVTISNLGAWLSALCYLASAALSHRSKGTIRPAGLWLGAGYALALGIVALVTLATFAGWLPVFFVEGQGGTLARHVVLGSAIAMVLLTAGLLGKGYRPALSRFVYWYTLALLLIATGLFGVMIQASRNTILDWTCRAAQYLGGAYMLVAALAAVRESGAWAVDLSATLAEAQAAAQQSENRYRLLAAATFEGIAVTEQGRFMDANDQLLRMLGCERAELLGRPVADWLPAEDRERVLANIRAGHESHVEHEMLRRDGTRLTVEAHGQTVAEGERAVRYTALRDITERKRTEEALRQSNEELTRFNRAAVDRELRMIELKKEINALCAGAGQPPRYRVESQKEQP